MTSTWRAATNLLRSAANSAASTLTTNANVLPPGTTLIVGSLRVEIVKKLAEGGFAFVYMVKDVNTEEVLALKRLLVNDHEDLAKVKEEIEFMKTIPRHKNIVEFRTAGMLEGRVDGKEILILMEFCPEPSLYEILDRRFKQYFTEPEVLSIFSQICEGVAHLHSLNPPVAHRDLKVENVLKYRDTFKLCDFGSATTKTFQPTDSRSIGRIGDELNRYTTPAYRSPEMLDLWQKHKIDEKVDIWALGCLLYRICFFVHPFDDGTNLQIINVNYSIPDNSPYSTQMHDLIQYMIDPNPETRPTIFQVMDRVSQIRGVSSPVSHIQRENRPSRVVEQKQPVVKQAPTSNTNDVFSMLDWHDSSGSTTRAAPAPAKVNQSSPQLTDFFASSNNQTVSAQPSTVADFADFSSANFVSASNTGSDTSFFGSNDSSSNQQPSFQQTNTTSNAFPTDLFSSGSGNNSSTQSPIAPLSPVVQTNNTQASMMRNSHPSVGTSDFSAFYSNPQLSSSGNMSQDLFSDFQSAPNTSYNQSGTYSSFSTPNSPMMMHHQQHMMNNQPQMMMPQSQMGSLFNSVALTPEVRRPGNTSSPTPSISSNNGDPFANLRNLM